MTDQTPRTEAGRRHLDWLNAGDDVFPEDALATVLTIEAEAYTEAYTEAYDHGESDGYDKALREAAERVRATKKRLTMGPSFDSNDVTIAWALDEAIAAILEAEAKP